MRKNAAAKAFAAAFFVAPYKKSPPPLTGTADIFKMRDSARIQSKGRERGGRLAARREAGSGARC